MASWHRQSPGLLLQLYACSPASPLTTTVSPLIPLRSLPCLAACLSACCSVGLLYHLYNQFAFNTLARISPVSHGVCNVVKRVAIIATSGGWVGGW